MLQDNIVIVVDTSNYKTTYSEKVPFKAKVIEKDNDTVTVKSVTTNKEYELYSHQILECLEIKDIIKILNLGNY